MTIEEIEQKLNDLSSVVTENEDGEQYIAISLGKLLEFIEQNLLKYSDKF